MFSKTTLALSAAIVISAAFPALAATKHHHRVTHAHSAIYNMVRHWLSGEWRPILQ